MENTQQQYIKHMLTLQNEFNNQTNGPVWYIGRANNGKDINWPACYYMELSEAINSFTWKHWVNDVKLDKSNLLVEVVDMFHFLLSEIIRIETVGLIQERLKTVEGYKEEGDYTEQELLALIEKLDLEGKEHKELLNAKFEEIAKVIDIDTPVDDSIKTLTDGEIVEQTLSYDNLLKYMQDVLTDNVTNKSSDNTQPREPVLARMMSSFYNIMTYLKYKDNFDTAMLYQYYIAKIALNQFRQENGYKEGTYKKIWMEQEDNEYAIALVKKLFTNKQADTLSIDKIKDGLMELYTGLNDE